jgi:hypothetical protein
VAELNLEAVACHTGDMGFDEFFALLICLRRISVEEASIARRLGLRTGTTAGSGDKFDSKRMRLLKRTV